MSDWMDILGLDKHVYGKTGNVVSETCWRRDFAGVLNMEIESDYWCCEDLARELRTVEDALDELLSTAADITDRRVGCEFLANGHILLDMDICSELSAEVWSETVDMAQAIDSVTGDIQVFIVTRHFGQRTAYNIVAMAVEESRKRRHGLP